MLRTLRFLCILLIVGHCGFVAAQDENLVFHLPFDEGSGAVTTDQGSLGLEVTLSGSYEWATGKLGSAVNFTGGSVIVVDPEPLNLPLLTAMAWVNPTTITANVAPNHYNDLDPFYEKRGSGDDSVVLGLTGGDGIHFYVDIGSDRNLSVPDAGVQIGEWQHIAGTFDGTVSRVFLNGEPIAEMAAQGTVITNTNQATVAGRTFRGLVDDLKVFDRGLTPEEVAGAMQGFNPYAGSPQPSTGATDVRYDVLLSWSASDLAASHDVYLGTVFDDVNEAARSDPRAVLVSEGQAETTFDPGKLPINSTFYWRVDEVNATPDSTIFQGPVWQFTTEPVAYPVPAGAVSATASTVHSDDNGPEKTVDGSGLSNGQHGTNITDMWLNSIAEPEGAWIQYDLGAILKLHHIHLWNHNTQTEAILGYGIQDALIETSTDGATWTELKTVTLTQASGKATYIGEDVTLDGVSARHVKITAQSNFSILGLKQVGLSEVEFYTLPVLAREPVPADGSSTDGVDVTLGWRPGREAAAHEVIFSQDMQAVTDNTAVVATVDMASYDVGTLDLGTQYFWRINEINDVETPSVYEGELWSFLMPEQIMIEDFEMYKAKEGLFIWEHWIDGFDDPGNNGAVVGNGDDPETVEVYEGQQSMPLTYNNTTAPQSEATRFFDPPLDLTTGNPERIEVYFKGIPYEFNGYYSVDGNAWNLMPWSPQYVVMSEDALIGMAVTSHDVALVTTAQFSNVSTTGNVTGDWTQADVGGSHPNESFTETNGVFTIKASGADIWFAADEFRYVFKNLTGAGSITAKAESLDHVHDWAKAGVMIRDAAIPEASFALTAATPGGTQGVHFQARLQEAVDATSDSGTTDGIQEAMNPPVWIRMERKAANGAAPVYMTLTDTSGKSVTIETEDAMATQNPRWTVLSAAPGDLNVNLSRIESIAIGVSGANVEGKIFVDTIRTARPYPAATE